MKVSAIKFRASLVFGRKQFRESGRPGQKRGWKFSGEIVDKLLAGLKAMAMKSDQKLDISDKKVLESRRNQSP